MNTTDIAVIILAAGKGTRMKSELPKVLHPMAGKPMLGHVITAAKSLNPSHVVVITGYGAEDVEAYTAANFPGTTFARQTEQLGTGHAVMQARKVLTGFNGTVIILYGDVPLVSPATLKDLLTTHTAAAATITLGTATAPNPTGLGRIIRNSSGDFTTIVEQKDATEEQRAITEINTGLYAATCPQLFTLLDEVTNTNAQGEYYLTDVPAIALGKGLKVIAHPCSQEVTDLTGVNNPEQLAAAEQTFLQRKPAA